MEQTTIQTAEQMRRRYFPCRAISEYDGQKDYFSYLKSKGVVLNPKLRASVFHLKNQLPFVGMAAKEDIVGGEVLIRVPEELILSCVRIVDQPLLREVIKDKYFVGILWQDKAMIIYCLFLLHQKDEKNPWFQMVNQFPKECDIACFWPEEELDSFIDQTVKSAALLELKSFEDQWKSAQQLRSRYEVLQFEQFNQQNFTRIFKHLANRSFGKKLSFISFVPLAQFFNHHCSKVYYTVEKEKQTFFKDQKEQNDSEVSSNGSCNSNKYFEQGQFDYDAVELGPLDEQFEQSYKLEEEQKQKIVGQIEVLLDRINKELNWQDFSVLFVANLIFKIKAIRKEYLMRRKTYQKAIQQLQVVRRVIDRFINQAKQYFKRVNNKSYLQKGNQESKQKEIQKDSIIDSVTKKEYQSLVIKTSARDVFRADNQIYFKYGRDSNRRLLLQYGFAIEGNKYEYFRVSFSILQCLSQFPDVLKTVMEKKLSLFRKYKLYNHRLNIDLIIFFRLNNWMFYGERAVEQIFAVTNIPKQIAILQQIRSILLENKQNYDADYDLSDKSLNYHQYFRAVYHLQKLKILKKQIHLFEIILQILAKLEKGISLQVASQSLSKSQRRILGPYLQSIRC